MFILSLLGLIHLFSNGEKKNRREHKQQSAVLSSHLTIQILISIQKCKFNYNETNGSELGISIFLSFSILIKSSCSILAISDSKNQKSI